MRTFNLQGVEILSTRDLASVKGGGTDSLPQPIIIVETSLATTSLMVVSAVSVVAPTTTTTKKKK